MKSNSISPWEDTIINIDATEAHTRKNEKYTYIDNIKNEKEIIGEEKYYGNGKPYRITITADLKK